MACFERWSIHLITALLALTLGGCSNLPGKKPATVQPPAPDAPFVKLPNPYLQQQKSPPAAANTAFARALALMQKEDWSGAQAILEDLTENHPDLSGPWVNLGIVHWRRDQLEQAEADLQQAIAVNPLNNEAYNQLGVLLREQGRFDEAEQVYLKALDVWPHAPVTLRNLGILYDLYMGRFDKALANYEMALKVAEGEDQQLQGWIIDIKRRLAADEAEG